ncbi:MAG: DPP IV N-terminal domain-containing protein, partial [Micromonosporaceae bacterium]|nr:DPP IV N-terminal domain-containing protein [Micromonosporaceae bacterium]
MEYPELAARTRRFTYGAPRSVTVSDDGRRVVFLRSKGPEDPSDALWVLDLTSGDPTERLVADPASLSAEADDLPAAERALRERLRLSASGIGSFALDASATTAAFVISGHLYRAELATGEVTTVPTAGPVVDPRPDPTGRYLAYVTGGALRFVDLAKPTDPKDTLLASEERATWGLAEFIAAEEFQRFRGYWWSPDGQRILAQRVDEARVPRWYLHDPATPDTPPRTIAYPHAGADNAEVTLHLLDLDGGWVDVRWDRETYPYLVAVSWVGRRPPLLAVMRRNQQHGLVLALDPRTGETHAHAELADSCWIDPVPGTPSHLPDGRVLVGGELNHEGYDARCLFADGSLGTPAH